MREVKSMKKIKIIVVLSCLILSSLFTTALAGDETQNIFYLYSEQDVQMTGADGVDYTIPANTNVPIIKKDDNKYEIQFFKKIDDEWKMIICLYEEPELVEQRISLENSVVESENVLDDGTVPEDSNIQEGENAADADAVLEDEISEQPQEYNTIVKNDGLITSAIAAKQVQLPLIMGDYIMVEEGQVVYSIDSEDGAIWFIPLCNSNNIIEMGKLDQSGVTAQIKEGTYISSDIVAADNVNVKVELIDLVQNKPVVLNVLSERSDPFTKAWVRYVESIIIDQSKLEFVNVMSNDYAKLSNETLLEYKGTDINFTGNYIDAQVKNDSESYLIPFVYYDEIASRKLLINIEVSEKNKNQSDLTDAVISEEVHQNENLEDTATSEYLFFRFFTILLLLIILILVVLLSLCVSNVRSKLYDGGLEARVDEIGRKINNARLEIKANGDKLEEVKKLSNEILIETKKEHLGPKPIDVAEPKPKSIVEAVIIAESGAETTILKVTEDESMIRVIREDENYKVELMYDKLSANLIDYELLKKVYDFENIPEFEAAKVSYDIVEYPVLSLGVEKSEYILDKKGKIMCN